jgi:hypothetical protein
MTADSMKDFETQLAEKQQRIEQQTLIFSD